MFLIFFIEGHIIYHLKDYYYYNVFIEISEFLMYFHIIYIQIL